MRVNSRVFTERTDMMGAIQIPSCPQPIRPIAENILNMITKLDYSISDYHTMTELDKMLMWDYWQEYDGMKNISPDKLRAWFIEKATSTELIRRARQWLLEHNYAFAKESVAQHAIEASEKFGKAIK